MKKKWFSTKIELVIIKRTVCSFLQKFGVAIVITASSNELELYFADLRPFHYKIYTFAAAQFQSFL